MARPKKPQHLSKMGRPLSVDVSVSAFFNHLKKTQGGYSEFVNDKIKNSREYKQFMREKNGDQI